MRKHSAKQPGTKPVFNNSNGAGDQKYNASYAKTRLTTVDADPSAIQYHGSGVNQDQNPAKKVQSDTQYILVTPSKK